MSKDNEKQTGGVKSLNADFEGIMPGVDQMVYDAMNQNCLTSQCLTDKGRALLEDKPANQNAALRRNVAERLFESGTKITGIETYPDGVIPVTGKLGEMLASGLKDQIPVDMTYNPKFGISTEEETIFPAGSVPQHKFQLSDNYGDRGVVCKVIPEDQMPKNADGTPADFVRLQSPFSQPAGNWLDRLRNKK